MAATQRRNISIAQPLHIKQEVLALRALSATSSPDQQSSACEASGRVDLSDHHQANGFHSSESDTPEHSPTLLGGRAARIQQSVEDAASPESRRAVEAVLAQIQRLNAAEKLLLYLKLPGDKNEKGSSGSSDPLRQPLNPLGTRYEIQQTITWIKTHLTEDSEVSLPKQDVYDEYTAYCGSNHMKPLSTADFGKVMKQVFPRVRPRRLGTRGNSRYCYAGLCKRVRLDAPLLPDLGTSKAVASESLSPEGDDQLEAPASLLIREWAQKLLGQPFRSLQALACHLVDKMCGDGRPAVAFSLHSSSSDSSSKHVSSPPVTPRPRENAQLQKKLMHEKETAGKRKAQQQEHDKQSESSNCRPASGCKRQRLKNGRSSVESPVRRVDFKKRQSPAETVTASSSSSIAAPTPPPVGTPPVGPAQKLPIPRLNNNSSMAAGAKAGANYLLISPPAQPKQQRKTKYKLIQPKPDPPISTEEEEAQFFTGEASSTVTDEIPAAPMSIPSLEKDALDDYLHGGNSQEQEEELMRYFQPTPSPPVLPLIQQAPATQTSAPEEPVKISQLRLLLEQNLTKDAVPLQNNTRRRVSFETSAAVQDPVPPSPNTRRRKFSFTPISPDAAPGTSTQPPPPSPAASATPLTVPSSAGASPFVSPRNTPVPRSRHNSGQQFIFPIGPSRTRHSSNGGATSQRGCASSSRPRHFSGNPLTRTTYTTIPQSYDDNNFAEATSAPESPMLAPAQMPIANDSGAHQRHRHVSAGPQLHAQLPQQPLDPLNQEVSTLLATTDPLPAMSQFRSQSVPLHQMVAGRFGGQFAGDVAPTPVPSEFTDFLENDNFDQFLAREHLNQLFMDHEGMLIEPNRTLSSRSYPNTPVPELGEAPLVGLTMPETMSRSYPSTPIVPDPLMSHLTLNAINQNPPLGSARRNLTELLDQSPGYVVDQTSFTGDQVNFAGVNENANFVATQEQPSFLMDDFDQTELTQLVQEVEGSSQLSQEGIISGI